MWGGGGGGGGRKLSLLCLSSVSYCDACEASALYVWKRDGGQEGGRWRTKTLSFYHITLCDASCSVCVETGGGWVGGRGGGQEGGEVED